MTSLLLFLWLGLAPATLAAQEPRVVKDFYGVVPGTTTEEELRGNEKWGQPLPLPQPPQPDGTVRLVYAVKPWDKVVAVLQNGVVCAVDLIPPAAHDNLETLATSIGLGPLQTLEAVPLGADVGGPGEPGWKMLQPGDSCIVLFVHETDGKQHVKLLRFYSVDAAVLPTQLAAAEPSKFRGWVPGFEMMIGPGSMLDGLNADQRRVKIQRAEHRRGAPLDQEGLRDYFSAVRILELDPDGPAARAGLKDTDVISAISVSVGTADGIYLSDIVGVRTPDEAFAILERFRTGEKVPLSALRGNERLQFKVTVGVKRGLKEFRGVVPGETTAKELLGNAEWGERVRESKLNSGITLWEYRIAPWSKVVAVIQDDFVRAIDFVPPPATTVKRISTAIGLGELLPIKTLPPSARVGGGDIGAGQLLAAEKIYAFMLADGPGPQGNVKLVRVYSPGSAGTAAPALSYVPASSNFIIGFDIRSVARDPRIISLIAQIETKEDVEFAKAFGYERWIDAMDHGVLASQLDATQIGAEEYQRPLTLILNMRAPFDWDKFLQEADADLTRVQHRGKVYYKGEGGAVCFPTPRTFVGSTLPNEQFLSIIESGGSRPSLPPQIMAAIRAIPALDVWFVMSYKPVKDAFETGVRQDENFAELPPVETLLEQLANVETLSGWGALEGERLRIVIRLTCTATSSAEKLVTAQQLLWDLMKSGFEAEEKAGKRVPEQLEREFVDTLRIRAEDSHVLLSAELSLGPLLAAAAANASQSQNKGEAPAEP